MKLQCQFFESTDDNYVCEIIQANITNHCPVKAFKGQHIQGKTHRNVTAVFIRDQTVHHLPIGIYRFFPNLKCLCVSNCGLKTIEAEALHGLKHLEILYLHGNQLKTLPDDLFVETNMLKLIDFSYNQLDLKNSKFFLPIPIGQWKYANFKNNKTITGWFGEDGDLKSMEELKTKIDNSSKPSSSAQPHPGSSMHLLSTKSPSDPAMQRPPSKNFKDLWGSKISMTSPLSQENRSFQFIKLCWQLKVQCLRRCSRTTSK